MYSAGRAGFSDGVNTPAGTIADLQQFIMGLQVQVIDKSVVVLPVSFDHFVGRPDAQPSRRLFKL